MRWFSEAGVRQQVWRESDWASVGGRSFDCDDQNAREVPQLHSSIETAEHVPRPSAEQFQSCANDPLRNLDKIAIPE
jgi:hypothetical protein